MPLSETEKTVAAAEKRRELARKGLYWFMRVYLSHMMVFQGGPREGQYCDSGEYGKMLCGEIDKALRAKGRLAGAIPRDHGKTTMGTTATLIMCVCLRLKANILLIGANTQEAQAKLRNVVLELEENELLLYDFGISITPKTDTRGATVASRDAEIIFQNGTRIRAIELGAKIRGQNVRNKRVDLVVLDDPEDDYKVQSDVERHKQRMWIDRALINSIQKDDGSLIWLGTILHCDSLLNQTLKERRFNLWQRLKLDCYKDDDTPLWPERWTIPDLKAKEHEIGHAAFQAEYRNNPIDDETQIFKPEFWQYYHRSDLSLEAGRWFAPNPYDPGGPKLPLTVFEGNDPAIGLNKQNDYYSWFVVGRQDITDVFFVLEIGRAKLRFTQQVMQMVERNRRWQPLRIGIEDQAYQAALAQQCWEAGMPVVGVRVYGQKKERFQTMGVRFEQGRIYLPEDEAATRLFVEEAEAFPNGRHDDQLDAAATALEVAYQAYGGTMVGGKRASVRILEGYLHDERGW